MDNYCDHTLESRLLKNDDPILKIICLLLILLLLIEKDGCCKKIDGGTF